MRAQPMWSPPDRRTKLAPRGGEFRPAARQGGEGAALGPVTPLQGARGSVCVWTLQVRARGFGVPGAGTGQERDAGPGAVT